jgi:hypothetical protein
MPLVEQVVKLVEQHLAQVVKLVEQHLAADLAAAIGWSAEGASLH